MTEDCKINTSMGNSEDDLENYHSSEFIDKRKRYQKFLHPQRRYVVCLMTFLAYFMGYGLRLNLNVAIVPMTANHSVVLTNGTVIQAADLNMDSKQKGYVLSAFYFGYIFSEIPTGWLTCRYGGATILGIGLLFSSFWAMLLPLFANYGPLAIIANRILAGLCEGGIVPCMNAIWSHWAPAKERTVLYAVSYMGSYMVSLIDLFTYGKMTYYFGWRSLFYIPGALSMLWCFIWFRIVKNNPADDSKITEYELKYLQENLHENQVTNKIDYPWRKILTSASVWAIVIADFIESWSASTVFITLPTFFNDYFKYDVEESGFLLSMSNIIAVISIPIVAVSADHLRKKYSTTTVRKLFNSIANVGQICCFLLVSISNSVYITTILFTMWTFFDTFLIAGYFVNSLDIAPPYAGLIMGISNSVANVANVLCATVAGYIVAYQGPNGWKSVFILCGILNIISGSFYLKFGSGKVQSWAVSNKQ